MKNHHRVIFGFVASVLILASVSAPAQYIITPSPGGSSTELQQLQEHSGGAIITPLSAKIAPAPVLKAMQRVADWQLAHPATNPATGWIQAVNDAGFMALAGISGDAKYRDAMWALGETNGWKLGLRLYDADDHCVGQTWAELYLLYRQPDMIAPLREKFDAILAKPTEVQSLEFTKPETKARENWSWCDALFMGPPTWVRLYATTGDERYLDFAVKNWWRTSDYLYDKDEHLFFRDSRYFKQKEANGKKVFWSRGNGWVMAGLVRTLQYLPMNHPDRPRFEQQFKDMAGKVLTCQQEDGLWRASLLDPESYPEQETSGSSLFTYALAWGVNQGLLDRAKFEPAVRKAWAALVECVDTNGKLTHVQPVGGSPKKFADNSTGPYGVGAFLLAGSEIYRLAVLENAKSLVDHPSVPPQPPGQKPIDMTVTWERTIKVQVTNPTDFRRECETVELNRYDKENGNLFGGVRFWPNAFAGSAAEAKIAVMDAASSRILDSQEYEFENDVPNHQKVKLLFQVDLAPGETRTFYILDASALAAVPPSIVKTFARYVPERYDDFAWESDRIAFRAYGLALIPAEGTISSAADVWIKKDRGLIIDTMYATKHYHEDNGSFMDDYRVGKSRGCGGLGIWDGKKLYTSSNWKTQKVITTGPIRSEFELTYEAWDAGKGRVVSETKRYSIDAGSWLTRAENTFSSEDKSPLTIGVGLAERACPADREEFIAHDQSEGWMTYWQPEDKPKGITAVAVILPKGSVKEFTNDDPAMPDSKKHAAVPQPTHEGYPPIRNLLAVSKAEVGRPFSYYFGACWDRSGDFTNHVQWENYVKRFAERRDQPLQVTVGK